MQARAKKRPFQPNKETEGLKKHLPMGSRLKTGKARRRTECHLYFARGDISNGEKVSFQTGSDRRLIGADCWRRRCQHTYSSITTSFPIALRAASAAIVAALLKRIAGRDSGPDRAVLVELQ
jgi:hypothetical protein